MRKSWMIVLIGLMVALYSCELQTYYRWHYPYPSNTYYTYDLQYEYARFKEEFLANYIPIYKEAALAYWNASISGEVSDWALVEAVARKQNALLSRKDHFALLTRVKNSNVVKDAIKLRELEVLYNLYLSYQANPQLLNAESALSSAIESKFNNFRTQYNGKTLTDNEVSDILRTSLSSPELKEVWTEQKKVGAVVYKSVLEVVKVRNQIAHELGYANYHTMSLRLSEQDPEEVSDIFDQLDRETRGSFESLKNEIDLYLSKRYDVPIDQLMPWHYQDLFFQNPIKMDEGVDFDVLYSRVNITKVASDFYSSIGLPIGSIIENSDLYSRPGKSQTAFCLDMDHEGDIRVLSNNKNNLYWMSTMLHELGHAVYAKNIDRSLPFILREPAHTFTTEAIAMLFERFATTPAFLNRFVTDLKNTENVKRVSKKMFAMSKLIFSRWSQVMYRFEKSLYENPDQDLNSLWWRLVEKYQLLKKPQGRNAPDWAAKVHIATTPCYYHNYLLGELLAAQLNNYLCQNVIFTKDLFNPEYSGKTEVGEYLTENVFSPGNLYKWDKMIRLATGEELTAQYYANEIQLSLS